MVSARAAASGPSMRRDRKSKARLIMFLLDVGRRLGGLGRFLAHRLLAEQVVVEHLARDRRGGGTPVLAVLHHDAHRDLRVVGGGEGDEERVVPVLLLHAALVVLL